MQQKRLRTTGLSNIIASLHFRISFLNAIPAKTQRRVNNKANPSISHVILSQKKFNCVNFVIKKTIIGLNSSLQTLSRLHFGSDSS